MVMRYGWVLAATAATAALSTATVWGQSDELPLDPGADRLAQLNDLIEVPSGVTDITGGLLDALAGMRGADPSWSYFMSDSSAGWSGASSWASSEASRRAIDAAIELTDTDEAIALGLPYGADGLDPGWVEADLANEAGRDGLIHTMSYGYLGGLSDLMLAMSVDAWSAAEASDRERVDSVMLAWVRLARIVADREMSDEKYFAYRMMRTALERFRDIVYTHPGLYDESAFRGVIGELDNDELGVDLVRLPRGDHLEALQLIERTIEPEGEVDPTKFGVVLAGGSVPESRPLELFARTAEMNTIGAQHAGWYAAYDELNGVLGDWRARWTTPDLHSPILERPSDYSSMDTARFRLIERTVGEIGGLFDERLDTLTELFGTRSAFAVSAFEDRSDSFPPRIHAVSPQFVDELDVDPWSILRRFRRDSGPGITRGRFEKSDVFQYFVPIRDQRWGPREEKVPYEITVTTGEPAEEGEEDEGPSFEISAREWDAWESNLRRGLARVDEMDASIKQFVQQLQMMNQMIQQMKGQLGTEEFERMVGRESIGDTTMTEDFSALDLRMIGYDEVNEQNAAKVAVKTFEFNFSADGLLPAYDEIRNMDDPSVDDYIGALRSRIEALEDAGALPYGEDAGSGSIGASFTVSFDDSTFLLYSVWENHEDDSAKLVGPEGTDYLLWPPVRTLIREAAGE